MTHPATRYAFGAAVVAAAYGLRVLLEPFTGTGAPFVLFFASVLVTNVFAGTGPGLLVLVVSAVLGAYQFVVTAGYSPVQAVWQAMLFTVDGLVVVYLSYLMSRARWKAEVSEARVRDLVELAPDAFFLADLDARFVDVNAAACRMLGYEREELVGKTILDVIAPEEAARLASVKAELLVPGRVSRGEWIQRRKDGTLVPVEVSSNILPDGRWQAFVRDIRERKRIEDERQVYVALLDNAPDFIGIADPRGVPIYLNPAGRRMVGLPLDYPVEKTEIPDYYTPDQRAFAAEVIVKSVVERGRWSGETSFRNWKTEERIPVSDEHFMIRHPQTGRVLGMGTVTRDISRSREAAREREEILARERFLAEVGPVLASSLGYEETLSKVAELAVRELADLCIVEVVEEGEEVRRLRVASRDASKAWLCDWLMRLPLDRTRPYILRSVLQTRQPLLLERPTDETIEALTQSEEHHRALEAAEIRSMVAVPLVVHQRLLGAIALVSSSASRVYGPSDVRLVDELATRAALSIENARLYRTAQRATAARDELLAVVAHDLRNPLGAILVASGLLRRRGGEPERRSRRPAEAIERSATRMKRLIEDLLDVSRMEAGRLSVEPASVPAEPIVADSIDAEKALAAAAALELRRDLPGHLPAVWADRDRLLQVLENLIGNAIKFTAAGGRVTVGARPEDGEVLFWVSDTGSGIPPEDLPRLFDRFWQGKSARRRGAGLGLPIVKGIVEAHGGRVWVETSPGQGSTFRFTIPTARPHGECPGPHGECPGPHGECPGHGDDPRPATAARVP